MYLLKMARRPLTPSQLSFRFDETGRQHPPRLRAGDRQALLRRLLPGRRCHDNGRPEDVHGTGNGPEI